MTNLTLKEIETKVMDLAKQKGFGIDKDKIIVAEKFALIHSEVSEAYEAYRKQKFVGKDCFSEELADVLIRTIQLCSIFGIDIEAEILKKLESNKTRVWDKSKLNENFV